jgi:hypothetical protein
VDTRVAAHREQVPFHGRECLVPRRGAHRRERERAPAVARTCAVFAASIARRARPQKSEKISGGAH